mmetsp:Transcript_22240/g.51837  ORF Transcript_22240/g.51837 Transcript_22240/m.51837 type:complete len:115 (-) Transcript_22240:296-640(-)
MFRRVHIAQYESLLLSPAKVVEDLSQALGVTMPATPVSTFSAAKTKKQSKGASSGPLSHEEAVSKLRQRSHLQALEGTALRGLCSTLNKELISDITESPHSNAAMPYLYDCQHH